MKVLIYRVSVVVLFIALSVNSFSSEKKEVVFQVQGSKFVHSIINKWIGEYKKEYPNASVSVNTEEKASENADIFVVTDQSVEKNAADRLPVIYVARYALLPVVNSKSALLGKASKGLKKKELKELLFEKDLLDDDDDEPEKKGKYTVTVYSRRSQALTTSTLAGYFGQSPEQLKGKKIIGDEIYLLKAIQKDETGLTFNTLNYVYDLNTRLLHSEISILPLHLKSKHRDALNAQNIDQTIALLESDEVESIPVEKFGFQLSEKNANNKEILEFVNWILTQGQRYNHECGFLTLDENTLVAQKKQLEGGNKLSYRD